MKLYHVLRLNRWSTELAYHCARPRDCGPLLGVRCCKKTKLYERFVGRVLYAARHHDSKEEAESYMQGVCVCVCVCVCVRVRVRACVRLRECV